MPTAKAIVKKTAKTTVRKPAKKVTIDDVWATIDEIGKTHREARRETEKTLNKAIGGLSNTTGSLVEHIMTPGLPGKFKQFGFAFDKITTVKWAVEGSLYADIGDHLERMEKVRKYADDRGDKRG